MIHAHNASSNLILNIDEFCWDDFVILSSTFLEIYVISVLARI